MDSLPVELIGQICSHLCMHCTEPDAFPDLDRAEARLAKLSLARFSIASRYMRGVAQPYLFHYYAAGDMTRRVVSENYSGVDLVWFDGSLGKNKPGRLPLFLRAIIQRPDLAAHVKALQLASPSTRLDNFTEIDMAVIRGLVDHRSHISRTSVAFQMLSRASEEIGVVSHNMFHPDFWSQQLAETQHNPGAYRHCDGQVAHTLEQLAILLCPRVRTLVLWVTCGNIRFWPVIESSRRTLPCLKKMGLLSFGDEPSSVAGRLISATAPNIKTFYVAPMANPAASMASDLPSAGNLPNVRRLVASDISVPDLARLVGACGQLRDLEYRNHGYSFSPIYSVSGPELLEALQPAKNTLRRLLLVSMTDGNPRHPDDIRSFPSIKSLRELEQLEELAINEIHVDRGFGKPYGTDLAEFLPRSIRSVHLMYVWSDTTSNLENLARDAPTRLPNLRSIRVSHMADEGQDDSDQEPEDWFPVLGAQHRRCQNLLAAASINVAWGRLRYKAPRDETAPRCEVVGPGPPGRYLATPYCLWESPDVTHLQ